MLLFHIAAIPYIENYAVKNSYQNSANNTYLSTLSYMYDR